MNLKMSAINSFSLKHKQLIEIMKTIWDIKGEFNKEFETLKKIQVEMKMGEKTQQPCQKTQWKALPTLIHSDDKPSRRENKVGKQPTKEND